VRSDWVVVGSEPIECEATVCDRVATSLCSPSLLLDAWLMSLASTWFSCHYESVTDGIAPPPSGTIVFFFTDIESSTKMWADDREAMAQALEQHDVILRSVIEAHSGYIFTTSGDSFAVAFARVSDAVAAAMESQDRLKAEAWPLTPGVLVRMGLHLGEAQERGGDYFGPAVNTAARIMSAGHGGQILLSGLVAELAEGAELVSLGRHRLRGLAEEIELWQIGTERYPRLRTAAGPKTTMPVPPTALVGREREVFELLELLGRHALVSVVGLGGLGKTRVAIEVGRQLHHAGNAVYFADLAPRSDATSVVEELCATVGLTEMTGDPMEALATLFNREPSVIVVDNCEHVLPHVRDYVASLRAACPQLRMLATSREPLGLAGERRYDLLPLTVDREALDLLRMRSEEAGSVQQIAEHAAIRLCSILDGIPLAIELTAPWLRVMDAQTLNDRLAADPFLADDGSVQATSTVRKAIDWSLSRLDDHVADLLCDLCLFPAGFTYQQAELLAERDPAARLAALADASLLQLTTTASGGRYRVLEPIRAHCIERSEAAGKLPSGQARQAAIMLVVAREIAAGLATADEGRWRAVIEAEIPNLASAVAWCASADPATGASIAAPFAASVSMLPPGVARLAIPTVEEADWRSLPNGLTVAALSAFARAYLEANPIGIELMTDVRAEIESLKGAVDPPVFVYLGTVQTILGDPVGAIDFYDQAVARAREVDDILSVAEGNILKSAWSWFARMDGWADSLREATELANDLGSPSLVSLCEVVAGFFALDDDLHTAEIHFEQALAANAPTGYGPGMAEVMLGLVHARKGDRDTALKLSAAGVDRFTQAGLQMEVGMGLAVSSATLLELGEPSAAHWVSTLVYRHFEPIAAMPGYVRYLEAARTASSAPSDPVPNTRPDAVDGALSLFDELTAAPSGAQ